MMQQILSTVVVRQSNPQPRATGEQGQVGTAGTEGPQIIIAEGVSNGDFNLLAAQLPNPGRDLLRPPCGIRTNLKDALRLHEEANASWHRDRIVAQQADTAARLLFCSTRTRFGSRIGVSGWVLHAGFIEKHVVDEQVTPINRSPVLRESRTGDGEVGVESRHQSVGDRTDVALAGRVERGAVLEEVLLTAGGA